MSKHIMRKPDGDLLINCNRCNHTLEYCYEEHTKCEEFLMQALIAYEDTNLEPKQIIELRQLLIKACALLEDAWFDDYKELLDSEKIIKCTKSIVGEACE